MWIQGGYKALSFFFFIVTPSVAYLPPNYHWCSAQGAVNMLDFTPNASKSIKGRD
jgi:hypothetical protein